MFGNQQVDAFFRLFGDIDGDRDVDNMDFARFRLAQNTRSSDAGYQAAFDFDGDGDVDNMDLSLFRVRYLTKLRF